MSVARLYEIDLSLSPSFAYLVISLIGITAIYTFSENKIVSRIQTTQLHTWERCVGYSTPSIAVHLHRLRSILKCKLHKWQWARSEVPRIDAKMHIPIHNRREEQKKMINNNNYDRVTEKEKQWPVFMCVDMYSHSHPIYAGWLAIECQCKYVNRTWLLLWRGHVMRSQIQMIQTYIERNAQRTKLTHKTMDTGERRMG